MYVLCTVVGECSTAYCTKTITIRIMVQLFIPGKAKTAVCSPKPKTVRQRNINRPLLGSFGRVVAVKLGSPVLEIDGGRHHVLQLISRQISQGKEIYKPREWPERKRAPR